MREEAAARAQQARQAGPDNSDDEDGGDGDEGDQGDQAVLEGGKLSKKEQRQQEKQARKQAREDMLRTQEFKQARQQEKDAKRDEIRKKKEEERLAKEKEVEDALAKIREEENKKVEEDYNAWKDMISVEGQGSAEAERESESQGMLEEMIQYIKRNKVVALDDLGARLGLPTSAVVNRITELEKMGMISGTLDDRGKFIFISPEEMEAVANFIKKRGRVSISDIATESNRLIDLTPNPDAPEPVDEGDEAPAAEQQGGEDASADNGKTVEITSW